MLSSASRSVRRTSTWYIFFSARVYWGPRSGGQVEVPSKTPGSNSSVPTNLKNRLMAVSDGMFGGRRFSETVILTVAGSVCTKNLLARAGAPLLLTHTTSTGARQLRLTDRQLFIENNAGVVQVASGSAGVTHTYHTSYC